MKITYDIHIHTSLSSCAKPDATVDSYLELAKKDGLKLIGFSNHMWDRRIPGASGWYKPQTFEHILQIKNEISKEMDGIKILFGCETEFTHDGTVAISEEVIDQLDYVLVPHSHTHMKLVMPPDIYDTDRKHAGFLVSSFMALVGHPLANRFTAVAHPFAPGVDYSNYRKVQSLITDNQLYECFKAAKEVGLFIEINGSCIIVFADGELSEYRRIYTIAKECGCTFTYGSDSHNIDNRELNRVSAFAESCGICEADFATIDTLTAK